MQFNDYQNQAIGMAQYPDIGSNLIYPALGLAGESGEVADKVKKYWRNNGVTEARCLTGEQKDELVKEIGDVLWYASALASELRVPLEDIVDTNLKKLYDRHSRGVIKSAGDNR